MTRARIGDALELHEELGRGGMGTVYKATHTRLKRTVAVKLLAPELADREEFQRRFAREAQALAMLTHPNIVTVHDYSDQGGDSYIVMEFVDGPPLSRTLPFPVEAAEKIAIQVCEALTYAHEKGVVHRDIKPGNVLLDEDGVVKITDFGIARIARSANLFDTHDDPVGTPQYMSPEALAGSPPDPRMDIYSVGVLLLEMITGRVSWGDIDLLPDGLGPVVHRAVSRNPLERYQTAAALRRALVERPEPSHPGMPIERDRNTNIAPAADPFIGRLADLNRLEELFRGGRRLVTLVGPPGIGKTGLAKRFSALESNTPMREQGGLWFCDLTQARDAEGVCRSLGGALRVPMIGSTTDALVRQLGNVLSGRGATLVILDNFEQVVDAGPHTVDAWLQQAPQTRFLVTSREALKLSAETALELDKLQKSDAVRLFANRAAAVREGFQVDSRNTQLVMHIVEKLDRLPLAIEIAAARMAVLPLDQLAENLDAHDAGSVALDSAIDWSWGLLEPWEQIALKQSSIFQGGFSLEAAEAVLQLSTDADALDLLDVLATLRDKSLLRTYEPDLFPGTIRFGLFESIRAFAARKLSVQESAVAAARHAAYYLGVGEEWASGVEGYGGVLRLDQLSQERANVSAVYHRSAVRPMNEVSAAMAMRALLALDPMLWVRGPSGSHLEALDFVLHGAPENVNAHLLGRALRARARAYRVRGELEKNITDLESARDVASNIDDPALLAMVLCDLGLQEYYHRGNMEQAQQCLERARDIAKDTGDGHTEGLSMIRLAGLCRIQGDLDRARKIYKQARTRLAEIGHERLEGIAYANIAIVDQEGGLELDEAFREHQEALSIHRRVGDLRSEAICLGNLAMLHRERDEFDLAHEHYDTAMRVCRRVGDRRREGILTGHYGRLQHELGRLGDAMACYDKALETLKGAAEFTGLFAAHQAAVLAALGQTDRAESLFAEAEQHFAGIDSPLRQAVTWIDRGHLELACGDVGAAEKRLTHPLTDRSNEVRLAIRLLKRSIARS